MRTLLLLALLAIPSAVSAQQVGSVPLRLGMQRAEAEAALRRSYELREVENSPGSFVVAERGGPPYNFIGGVGFDEAGTLSFVNRSWTATTTTPTQDELMRAVIGVLSGADGRSCQVDLEVFPPQPGSRFEYVELHCGDGHILAFSYAQEDGYAASVNVSESWRY